MAALGDHPPEQPADAAAEPRRSQQASFWREFPILVLVALTVAVLIKSFLVQAFYIPSGSMEPTLLPGDRVLVNKLAYRLGEPVRGDIVVFDSPFSNRGEDRSLPRVVVRNVAEALGIATPASEFIKRVIALPGDTVEIDDGLVFVNGELLEEPYLSPERSLADLDPEVVPAGHLFVLGDNRTRSQDSRVFGPVPLDEVVGKAFVKVWPPSRWGGF